MVILHFLGSTGRKKMLRQEKKQEEKVKPQEDPFPTTRRKSTRQWLSFLHTVDLSQLQVISPSCQGAQSQSFSSALGAAGWNSLWS